MKIKVKAQPGQTCRLSDAVCVTETVVEIELTTVVRRRLRDGSLIECKKKRGNVK
jgi:hypothetical protein